MPWKETCVVEERLKFVNMAMAEGWPFADLCRSFGISRKTGYKILERYRDCGLEGLMDASRAPIVHPNAVSEEVRDMLIAAREDHPHWGPKKIKALLERQTHGMYNFPVPSTIGEIFKRAGLVQPARKRRRSTPTEHASIIDAQKPNEVWCADFKGHFRTGDAKRCTPLTISDAHSRFLLCCQIVKSQSIEHSKQVFSRIFTRYGLPKFIRTDNGIPFACAAFTGLTKLSAWWIKLGITPQRIEPGKPYQNGIHERMHLTLKRETAIPPKKDLPSQQKAFDRFKREFNTIRPHEALQNKTPSDFYYPSPKPFPEKEPEIIYPNHYELRQVHPNGCITIQGKELYISQALVKEIIGIEQITERQWRIYFAHVPLGIFDTSKKKMLSFRDGAIS